MRFLDTNVLLRYFTADNEERATAALALLERVQGGEEKIVTSALVVFETVFTLQKFYGVAREEIRNLLCPVLTLQGLKLTDKPVFLNALERFTQSSISFADIFNACYMESKGISEIYSWDTDFDKIPTIVRIPPK